MKKDLKKVAVFLLVLSLLSLVFACKEETDTTASVLCEEETTLREITNEQSETESEEPSEQPEEEPSEQPEEEPEKKTDYSRYFRNIMEQAPTLKDIPITRLSFLGSHDAFTDKIDKNSRLDTSNTSNGVLSDYGLFSAFKGVYVNYAKAQADDVYVQLMQGTRYLDMRASEVNGEMYTCHTLISDTFRNGLLLVLQFLEENPGEFVLITLSHYYTEEADPNGLRIEKYMREVTLNGKNIFDYIHYDETVQDISSLTYNSVTNGGTSAGVVLACDIASDENPTLYRFCDQVYSPWTGIIDSEQKMEYILQTIPIALNKGENTIRICQAQTTPNSDNILGTLASVSLLEKAMEHNDFILYSEHFDEILDTFPIFIFDYVTYNETGFLDTILQKMTEKNLSMANECTR